MRGVPGLFPPLAAWTNAFLAPYGPSPAEAPPAPGESQPPVSGLNEAELADAAYFLARFRR